MAKVANDYSPLFERLMFGYDGTDYRVIKVDTDGNLVAAVKAGQEIEVVQTVAADLKATVNLAADQNVQARLYGWLSGAWQKTPLVFGYTDVVSEEVSNTNAAAGNNTLISTTVPAGEIWVINSIAARDNNSAITAIIFNAGVAGVGVPLLQVGAVGANLWTVWNGQIIIKEGGTVSATLSGCTLNDDLLFRYGGYKMDIDQ